jgi:hypothetical protein
MNNKLFLLSLLFVIQAAAAATAVMRVRCPEVDCTRLDGSIAPLVDCQVTVTCEQRCQTGGSLI